MLRRVFGPKRDEVTGEWRKLHNEERSDLYCFVFGPKRDEVTGQWRKLHNEELSYLYSLPNVVRVVKSRSNEMGGACGAFGGGERCAQGSGGET